MSSLTIRNIPENVVRRLRRAAKEEKRSMNAQAIRWLEEAAQKWNSRRDWDRLLRDIRSGREAIYRSHGLGSDSAEIIRQMRDGCAKIGQ